MGEVGAPSPPPPQTLENPIYESQKLGNEIEETSSSKKRRKEPEPDQADPETEDSNTRNPKKPKTEVFSFEDDDSNCPLPLQRMENGLVLHSLKEALNIGKWHAAGDINSEAEEEEKIIAIVVVAAAAACVMAAVWCYEKYYKPQGNKLEEEERAEEMIANAMQSVASAIRKINKAMNGGNRWSKMNSLFAEIRKVPNLSEPLFFKAYKYLAADEHKATLFLVLDENTRREWLLMHLDEV